MDNKIFSQALDALNEYMANQGAHVFDAPTEEFSCIEDGYVHLGCATNSYGKYEIATGKFTQDREE